MVVRATGLPGGPGEAAFLAPALVSLWLHGRILLASRGARKAAGPPSGGPGRDPAEGTAGQATVTSLQR
ncbi:MAG: hypothetical protein EDX89_23220 [Acidobacteria bacterium]|nr:MAG: hypothetical protein EDX89_23220 [Acidobacteriota bacterium]MCE7957787.1 hypothetical protein [Acidobacteria bacterium ACB2]